MGSPQPPSLGPREFLTLSGVYSNPPAICHSQFRLSCPGEWLPGWFPPMSLCSGKSWLPVFACLSLCTLWQWVCLCPSLPYGAKKSVGFSVCSDFYLLWWSGDFQVPYMWHQIFDEGRFTFFFSFRDIQVVYFFLSALCYFGFFKKFVHFVWVFWAIGIKLFIVFLTVILLRCIHKP